MNLTTNIFQDNAEIRYIWAKKSIKPDVMSHLPLCAHLSDAAEAAGHLWDTWLPENIRRNVPRKLLVFLAAAHDLGKATPVFQSKESRVQNKELDRILITALTDAGFQIKDYYSDTKNTRHELASHMITKRHGLHNSLSVVLSGHHGKPPNTGQINNLRGYSAHLGFNSKSWIEVQDFLFFNALSHAGISLEEVREITLTRPEQALLTGLVILSDWIASDEELFPLVDIWSYRQIDSTERVKKAFAQLDLPTRWEPEAFGSELYDLRFGIETDRVRAVQETALAVARMAPGIMIIEAPMGEGKTEAALAAAEILAGECGLRGIYFALPTQATSNAMFGRVIEWIEKFDTEGEKYSVRLTHGKAGLNENYRNIKLSRDISTDDGEEENNAYVHEWFAGRKKGILADFAVGTIDHVLMMGLKQKHLALRHLGLAGKVVVLDEVHAYDVYMNSYLLMSLAWLGAYGVPVVVLSATLPVGRRNEIIDAYTGRVNEPVSSLAYPVITYSCGGKVECEEVQSDGSRSREVSIRRIGDETLTYELEDALAGGGCIGIIVNTVKRAQEIYQQIVERFGQEDVYLLHARLLACDRSELEAKLANLLGPPHKAKRPDKLILIGTQVLEQSLDFDFDLLISDLCPMDLLLQRIGRLHRHQRERPERLCTAECLVLGASEEGPESGAKAVYGEYLLLRTRALLPDKVSLPNDIPVLVAGVYDDEYSRELAEAREIYTETNKKRKSSAKTFQIGKPISEHDTLMGWLDTSLRDDSEKRGEAAVRDSSESIEVIVIRQFKGELRLLPWVDGGCVIPPPSVVPENKLAVRLAECTVRLPAVIGTWNIEAAIDALEGVMVKLNIDQWYASPLLKGSLCLVLDENMETVLCGYRFRYDKTIGLLHEKEE